MTRKLVIINTEEEEGLESIPEEILLKRFDKIYCSRITKNGWRGLRSFIEEQDISPIVKILEHLMDYGKLVATENEELTGEATWILAEAMIGSGFYDSCRYEEGVKKRILYISQKIEETLRDGEVGILFSGLPLSIPLPEDIKIVDLSEIPNTVIGTPRASLSFSTVLLTESSEVALRQYGLRPGLERVGLFVGEAFNEGIICKEIIHSNLVTAVYKLGKRIRNLLRKQKGIVGGYYVATLPETETDEELIDILTNIAALKMDTFFLMYGEYVPVALTAIRVVNEKGELKDFRVEAQAHKRTKDGVEFYPISVVNLKCNLGETPKDVS